MGKKAKAPAPPKPMETAAASTSTNIGTAIANNAMGMVNQVGPDGSLTYSQNGTYVYKDPYTGKSYNLPQYTATTALSGMGQQIKGQNDQTQLNMAQTGNQQSAFLKDYLGTPWNPDTSAIEGRLTELGRQRIDPLMAQRRSSMDSRLANQGITQGSEAYNREMGLLGQQENDAYNSLFLQGRGQAFNELQTTRNQPINEISALLGGSQVSQPGYQAMQPQGAATTDVAGLINANYDQRLNNYNQQQAGRQSIMGGLFGLGSSLITSDRRLKEDIKRVGKTDGGLGVYTYRYKGGDDTVHMGVMAQELEKKNPDAVHRINGFRAVDYKGVA